MPAASLSGRAVRRAAVAFSLVALVLSSTALPAHAAKRKSYGGEARHRVHGKKIIFDRGSEETAQQRERRLMRECRGRPNAGLCAGYGQ